MGPVVTLATLLIALTVAISCVTYVVRKGRKDGTRVPWIGAVVVGILSLIGIGGIIATVVWKNHHDDELIRRKLQREAYEASRVKPLRSPSTAQTRQQVATAVPTAVEFTRATSRLSNTNGTDLSDPVLHAKVIDGIIDSILQLYPDHPHSRQIRANRGMSNGHQMN